MSLNGGTGNMSIAIIVEGKNDRSRLRRLLSSEVDIYCTYGTPGTEALEQLKKKVGTSEVYVFTDNDSSGKKSAAASGTCSRTASKSTRDADTQAWKAHPRNT